MFKFREDHPYRPVNWRWERARILKEYGFLAPGQNKDDKWVKLAAKFRTAKDKCKDEASLYKLYDQWPDLAIAYELWDEENAVIARANPMRHEIEARILAREGLKQIAAKAGVSPLTILYYEKLFFNVTDRIDNKMYIFHIAIGDAIHRGMTDRDFAVLWKIYGYVRGPHMLNFLITTFSDWSRPTMDKVEDKLRDDHRSNMGRKAALASRMSGINHHTADRLIELHTKIMEVEKAANQDSPDGMHNNIQVMLNHLPLLVGQKSEGVLDSPISKYRNLTGDLRANELLELSAGKDVDPEFLTEFEFPKVITDDKEIGSGSGDEAT